MKQKLTPAQVRRIADAITAAEKKTAGEIFVVVAARADDYRLIPVLWAAVAALVLVWPLAFLTSFDITTLLFIQAAIFLGWCVALTPDAIRLRLIPRPLAASNAERAAREQFLSHGVHLTKARTGVLIYAALTERRVEIVADDGIAEKVGQKEWDDIARCVISGACSERLGNGLVQAVRRSGDLLARHFPPEKKPKNQLPNRVVQL